MHERVSLSTARRTKIVATLGPASSSPEVLRAMIDAGLDVARINLSHGDLAEHLERLALVRRLAAEAGRDVAVLADLPGPKLRAGEFADGPTAFTPGSLVTVVAGSGESSATHLSVGYPTLTTDLHVGDRVVLGDGAISMRVVAANAERVLAEVETGGVTQGRPGVHLASARLQLQTPTSADLVLAEAVAAAGVDYVALSFTRRAADVEALRAVVGTRARIVAKIETAVAAVAALGEIAASADAIMVARGDLGIDVPLADVPHLQKRIIRHCVEHAVPVITATQMLESMITAPSPTRAEVTDVANAVFDGTDAVMLSGETAIGHDPALVIATMATIAERAEADADYRRWGQRVGTLRADASIDLITVAVTHAAWQAAVDVDAAAIICCTRSGRAARSMVRFRPESRLLALSPDSRTRTALALSWGVEALAVSDSDTIDEMVWLAVERAVQAGLVHSGDAVVVVAGAPDRITEAAADVMRIVTVS